MTDSGWLDAIEARLRAATPGPWRLSRGNPGEVWANRDPAGWDAFLVAETGTRLNPEPSERALSDAEFIAHAPEDIETLLAAVRERDAEIERRQRWKAESLEVLSGWESVWVAAGKPGELGTFKHGATAAEVEKMRAALARVEALAARFETAAAQPAVNLGQEWGAKFLRDRAAEIRAALAGEGEQ